MSASSPVTKRLKTKHLKTKRLKTKDPKTKPPKTQALQKAFSKAMATARVQTLFVPAFR